MKKLALFALSTALLIPLSACGDSGTNSTTSNEPPDLIGEWKEKDADSDSYQAATISDGVIEVYWVSDGGDTKSLYWAGTYVAPTTTDEPYSWDSENDHEKTNSSILASGDDTKTFTYENGELSYSVSAFGTTTTMRLEKE